MIDDDDEEEEEEEDDDDDDDDDDRLPADVLPLPVCGVAGRAVAFAGP